MTTDSPRWLQADQVSRRPTRRPILTADYASLERVHVDDREAYSAAEHDFVESVLHRSKSSRPSGPGWLTRDVDG
jgi:hypothetical protein